ncbi:helix-turn-helix domain-containing protein [Amycolatopsis sp. NPDC005232]|uniref:winged helix-turn-helix transcriptional regulator n=1 Tax=Amycolatopsis sp. NPDC005232 TaxID=3157027 RepID=UPI0033B3591D
MTERSYDDACAMARALDVVGERWTLLVVRELLLGPKRFGDLRSGLPTISQNVLTRRIREMEQARLVERILLDPPANTPAYRLTTRGLQLRPVLIELSRWGVLQSAPPGAEQSPAALLLGFSALYEPARMGATTTAVLTIGRENFTLTASTNGLQVEQGAVGDVDFRATGTVGALRVTLGKGGDPKSFEDTGELTIIGDRAGFVRLSHCFPSPALLGRTT